MKNVNFKPISGWLWLLYKIADNNCRSRLFTEFIQTQKRYLTLLDKTVFRSSRPQVFLRKVVLKNTQQIYRRTPIPKCDFNKVALHLLCILIIFHPLFTDCCHITRANAVRVISLNIFFIRDMHKTSFIHLFWLLFEL